MRLLGDLVHDAASRLGLEECPKCALRREALNAANSFTDVLKALTRPERFLDEKKDNSPEEHS